MPNESIDLGPNLIADGKQKQNHNSVSRFPQTVQEVWQPVYLPPLFLDCFFFTLNGWEKRALRQCYIEFMKQHCPCEEICKKKPQSFLSEPTFSLETSILWEGSWIWPQGGAQCLHRWTTSNCG